MKKYYLYFIILFISSISIYLSKIYIQNFNNGEIILSKSTYNKPFAEIEILNGCGISGIAELFTNFLRTSNYDVVSIENSKDNQGIINFNHEKSKIIILNKDKLKIGYELSLKLGINKKNIIKSYDEGLWDLRLIIGSDYNRLNSFTEINKSHEPF